MLINVIEIYTHMGRPSTVTADQNGRGSSTLEVKVML